MGSLANNKASQAKPNLNTQRDGSVELVITTGKNTLNFSGFLNGVTSDLIKHLSARILETPHGIQNRLLADADRPGFRLFDENTRQELADISQFLTIYLDHLRRNPTGKEAKPDIQGAHIEIRHPYEQIQHIKFRNDIIRLTLPKNERLKVDLDGSVFRRADADGGEQLLEIPFILTTDPASTSETIRGLASNLDTIRGLAQIIGQMGKQLFDRNTTHGV